MKCKTGAKKKKKKKKCMNGLKGYFGNKNFLL